MISYKGKSTKKLRQLTGEADNLLLVCHVNPDGDAVGSMIALYDYFSARGKKVSMLSPNYLQNFLLWMKGATDISVFIRNKKRAKRLIEAADLIICLDFNNPDRLGEAREDILRSDARKIIIDHHVDPADFADLVISETSFCATAELVHLLVQEMNGEEYSSDRYSEAIYVGIITDTGNFVHGSFTGDTLRIVGKLLDNGIDKERVYDRVYNNFSEDRMKLVGMALSQKMKVLKEYNTAYIWLTGEDQKRYNYVKGDTEGLVNMPLSIKGISFAALFIEKEGHIKLSFRSKGDISVNDFAVRYFNGGGHVNAAGGEYKDTLEMTIECFEASVAEFMNSSEKVI